ncbi:hypothetical protein F4604DRAFT_1602551 [Suillus subluteus]|nr:hypothetical protein F4604DRAFT_1602551 [Suillus subluteus]
MNKVLEVLQNSSIVSKSGKDNRSRFWEFHAQAAEEHDNDFLDRYSKDMGSILLFSGLFSTVSSSFIVAMESNLSPDPSDTTNTLLTQLVQIGLGNFTAAGSTPLDPASTWSPSASTLRIQMVAYASLSMSLLAAFAAVLGKAVARLLQVQEIWSRLTGGTREAQTRDVRRPHHLVFRCCRAVLSCLASDLPSPL